MAISAAQEAAFTGGTIGVPMSSFSNTILFIFFSILYLWVCWVIVTQWKSWMHGKINFYDFLTRSVRSVFLTLFLGFILI
ncbi:MAG: TIGR03758 family integrating conjugative element protein [Blastopirellula sp.]|nr:MAG: TIGR03758 family integrating conjugative element protein [Blastopirellula sp.]